MILGAASCDKSSSANSGGSKGVVAAIDNANTNATKEPVDTTPLPGVDISKLSSSKKDRFYKLVGSLASPCGKSHSLRTSLLEDDSCKRAPFAARYLVQMLDDEVEDEDIEEFYGLRYVKQMPVHQFHLDDTVPHHGPADAPVRLVEFFDYGCPACKQFKPLLEEALSEFPNQAALFYKQFPLPSHTHSKGAAQAALAAHKQGKFAEMHSKLFAHAPNHQLSELQRYAAEIGLDMAQYKRDFAAVLPRVEADIEEGDKADVHGTPSLFINGRQYEGPAHPKYIQMWIEEELAVNQ